MTMWKENAKSVWWMGCCCNWKKTSTGTLATTASPVDSQGPKSDGTWWKSSIPRTPRDPIQSNSTTHPPPDLLPPLQDPRPRRAPPPPFYIIPFLGVTRVNFWPSSQLQCIKYTYALGKLYPSLRMCGYILPEYWHTEISVLILHATANLSWVESCLLR